MKRIHFVIPTRNNNDDLLNCLKSINRLAGLRKLFVYAIVVDDHSTKLSREVVVSNIVKFNMFKNIKVHTITLSKSYGFAKCCNIGLQSMFDMTRKYPDFIGILHDDVVLPENWLLDMLKVFEDDKTVDFASSITSNQLDKLSWKSVGDIKKDPNVDAASLESFIEKKLKDKPTIETSSIQLCSCLARGSAFKKYGIFDDLNLSSFTVEDQYSKKVKKLGAKLVEVQSTCVLHKCNTISSESLKDRVKLERSIANWIDEVNETLDSSKKFVCYTYAPSPSKTPEIVKNDDTEYVCFTSCKSGEKSIGWKFIDVRPLCKWLDVKETDFKVKQFIKLNPHLLLKPFKESIWIDSTCNMKKDVVKLASKLDDSFMMCLDDPYHDCAYEILLDIKESEMLSDKEFDDIFQVFKWCNYPPHNGMVDTSIMFRRHMDLRCIIAMTKIWHFVGSLKANDKLFFNLVLWLSKFNYLALPAKLVLEEYIK